MINSPDNKDEENRLWFCFSSCSSTISIVPDFIYYFRLSAVALSSLLKRTHLMLKGKNRHDFEHADFCSRLQLLLWHSLWDEDATTFVYERIRVGVKEGAVLLIGFDWHSRANAVWHNVDVWLRQYNFNPHNSTKWKSGKLFFIICYLSATFWWEHALSKLEKCSGGSWDNSL